MEAYIFLAVVKWARDNLVNAAMNFWTIYVQGHVEMIYFFCIYYIAKWPFNDLICFWFSFQEAIPENKVQYTRQTA